MSSTMRASAVTMGTKLAHAVDVNGRHTMVTDEPVALGGSDLGPAPHELLAAALASCAATTVARYAARKGWELMDLAVDVEYEPDAAPRRFSITLRLPAGLSPEQVGRLERVAATCPVRRALEGGCSIEERVLIGERTLAKRAA